MKSAKILLVDDEVVFTNNVAKLLSNRGYQVKTANSGYEALAVLMDNDFDVMVLDLKMPGIDGIATIRDMKKLGLPTEVLILTVTVPLTWPLKPSSSGL